MRSGALLLALAATAAAAQGYRPADSGQRPAGGGAKVLPEQFLRGYDPITLYYPSDEVGPKADADDGPARLKLVPQWPGAYAWVDRRTLQFRPAEPWPALARYQVTAAGQARVLTTMMSAPTAMAPSAGSEGLKPFRAFTLTFPQALPAASLKKMISLELRDLPGLGDSPARKLSDFSLAQLPRSSHRDPVTWAVTLPEDLPEGKQLLVDVALALGSEGTTLWQGRAATRRPFELAAVRCANAEFPVVGGGSTPRDLALACGNRGDAPQLAFSAPVANLSLTALRKLVRLEPAVPDLHFQTYGARVQLLGKFVPDTLYKMTLASAPLVDDAGRPLREVKGSQVYFHLAWKAPYVRWTQATALLEVNGPRMLPLAGYGEPRADVRIYRIDPLHNGLWPFPGAPVVVDEDSAPPFPGEEPPTATQPGALDGSALTRHLRLLGSPLVSRVVDLPLSDKSGATTFGLDLRPLLDGAVGPRKPGTYLVGLRRLTGRPERAYMRVQVTNLSVTSVEESGRAVLFVRALDTGAPVAGATVKLEGRERPRPQAKDRRETQVSEASQTDAEGRVVLATRGTWSALERISVTAGDDVLVLDPREAPPTFENDHWGSSGSWLSWLLTEHLPPPRNDATLAFLFTERPIYRPGDAIHFKAYVRQKVSGELRVPAELKRYGVQLNGPDGQSWKVPTTVTPLGALQGELQDGTLPTGDFTAVLYDGTPDTVLARRPLKLEAYRVPTFEVQLTGATRVRNDGPFKVKALARYYAGGNVANQPIKWTVTQRPSSWVPEGHQGFLFASSTQFSRPSSVRAPGLTAQEGALDDDGAAELTLNPQLDLDGSARTYRFEATVTGPDEQPVTAYTEVRALPAFVLGLKVPRYLEKATQLSPQLLAVGVDDKPSKGQEVQVRLLRRVWHSTLRETSFATGQAKYVTEQEDVEVAKRTVTTLGAALTQTFPLAESGVYVVELTARDKLGRVQSLSADLYVGGQTPQAWQKSRDGVFELKPDQKEYQPGETAHVVVQSPYTQAQALVVVEEPSGNRYRWLEVRGGKAVVDVPITERFVPNLPVHVLLMRGRLGEGKTDDARYKPATAAASVDLVVKPTRNAVKVQVQHPETVRPGTRQDFVVTLADEAGRPLAGEVTLWLVDEAVLSLAKEASLEPLEALVRRNARALALRDTRNLVVGRVAELEEEPGGDGGEGDEQANGSRRMVRKNFKTVPFYQATLEVPASGRLVVPIQLSDDLTNFKVRAMAVAGATRFGFKQSVLRQRLPVLVQPQLPRFVRMGDRFWPGGVARLVEGAEGPGTVAIKVSGLVEGKALFTEQVALKLSQAQSVLTPVTVKTGVAGRDEVVTVRVDVTRLSDKAGDAFEVKLPLLPDRPVERGASFVTLQPGKTTLTAFTEPLRAGTGSQSLTLSNQPGVLELASGLEYLSQYPHGCLEQRMSQVWPDLSLATLLKSLELDTRFTPGANLHVRRVLDDFPQHQDEQGFLAYWPGAQGDVALTAQGLEFLTAAKRVGLPVDEKVRGRVLEALRRVLRNDFTGLWAEYRYNQQSTALRALVRAGEVDENYLIELFHKRTGMDALSRADLLSAMAERPSTFAPNLGAMKGELWDAVVFKQVKGQPVFQGIRGDRTDWSGRYLGSSTATTAAVWEALLRVDPANPKHDLLRDALLSRGGQSMLSVGAHSFGTTHDNRRAIAALGLYLEKARTPQPQTTVTIPGAKDVVLDAAHKGARRTVEGDGRLTVSVSGAPVGARVQYRYLPAETGDKIEPRKEGLIVSRTITWLHPDGSQPTHHVEKPGGVLAVGLGDVLEVHAQLVNDQPRTHVALVVPIAAGLEPLNPNLETSSSDARPSQPDSLTPTAVQRLDQEVRYYFTELRPGTFTFHFRVRASSEGSYVQPPPSAELMYREEVRGRGAGVRVVVKGTHEQ